MQEANLTLPQIFTLLSTIFILGLGIIVFLKDKKSTLNRLFALITLVFAIWITSTFMMLRSSSDEDIIFWDRLVYLGVVFMPALQYHFSIVLTHTTRRRKVLLIAAYILSFVFLGLSRTDYFVDGVFRYKWGVHTEAKIFHHFFLIFFFFYIFALLNNFISKLKEPIAKIEKARTLYILVGFAILNLLGGVGYMPAYRISIYSPISFGAPLLFSIITAYAIITHRLMDIKLALRKSTIYILSLITILIPAFIIIRVSYKLFPKIDFLVDLIILLLAISTYSGIKKYYFRIANEYCFSSLYDSQKVITKLIYKLRSTLELDKVYNIITKTLTNTFHPKAAGILIFDKKKNLYIVQKNIKFNIGKKRIFTNDDYLYKKYALKNQSIIVEEIKDDPEVNKKSKETINMLNKLNIEIIIPLNIKKENIGIIILGPKESGDMYNSEDLKVLKTIGAQSAIAVENALLYKEIIDFNIKLKEEVKKATTDLRKANKELKQLDKAKSDFISIASHQLRTPLTVIKGYVSMLLEGDYGKINVKVKESLDKVYLSSERLIRLIENLLNISRIESGRMQYSFQEKNIEDIVKSVYDDLVRNAAQKGLKLEYIKPQKPLPKIKIDPNRIREVIMNLTDNAIKYTKNGTITIKIKLIEKNIHFCIEDTGMGIRKDDLPRLFKKFSRGTGTFQIHTEGTGLGLYVAQEIIKVHKGKIWASSEGEGKGSKFCFELPII